MNMQCLFCVWFAIIGCLVHGVDSQPPDSPRECAPWTRLSNGINQYQGRQGDGVDIACKDHSHDKCEQLDCGGTYILDFVGLKFNVCLGLVFHHCASPPVIEVSIQVPTFNSSLHRMVAHNVTIPVPGLHKDIGNNRAEIVVTVELRRRNMTSFSLKMSGRVRMTMTVFGREITEWPEDLQRDIITIDDIPVTNCTTRTNPTLSKLKVCDVSQYISTSHASTIRPVVTTTKPPIIITSVTYNQSCVSGSMRQAQCGFGEACINNRCLCAYDYKLSSYGVCHFNGKKKNEPILYIPMGDLDPSNTGPPGMPKPASQHQAAPTNKINKTAMIIGGSVGGLVVVVAIVIVIVVLIRKRGARYQGRELLLTEDDTDGAM